MITLLASLAVKYGAHRFTAALLLNIWFLIALSLPVAYTADHVHTSAWPQAPAWLIGSALMIGYIGVMWLATGRSGRQETGAELLPGDTTPVPLTRPVIMYAVLRAVAVANLSEEARRVGFTFAGVGIAMLVTYLASLLAKRTPPAAQP